MLAAFCFLRERKKIFSGFAIEESPEKIVQSVPIYFIDIDLDVEFRDEKVGVSIAGHAYKDE